MALNRLRFRAPWRWRWGQILFLALRCGVWAAAVRWSPFFAIALAFWIFLQLRAAYTQPLPSPTETPPRPAERTGQTAERKYNGAQITITNHDETTRYTT